jgi:hypothetical protein
MFVKKFMAAALSLGLICGGASLVYAGNESVNLVEFVNYNYTQMSKDKDLRRCCLVRITDSTDESFLLRYEDYMLKNPEAFKHDLVSKLSKDEKFKENYSKFLEACERNQKAYEEFLSKRPRALKWPPTWD